MEEDEEKTIQDQILLDAVHYVENTMEKKGLRGKQDLAPYIAGYTQCLQDVIKMIRKDGPFYTWLGPGEFDNATDAIVEKLTKRIVK